MTSSNSRKGAAFMAFARQVGPFPTSALATADATRYLQASTSRSAAATVLPPTSATVNAAARHLVGRASAGAPSASGDRVERVAKRLERLVELEREASLTRGRVRESA